MAPFVGSPAYTLAKSNLSLDPIFKPKSVAVIGATEAPNSVGRTVLWNLISNPFGGIVFPINPKRPQILGLKAYPAIGEVPDQVDLAVIITPAPTVPGIISQCVEAGVKGAIIISAGFKEIGEEGAELEKQTLAEARRGQMRLIGPNCLGVMNPLVGLNATFAAGMARPGNVAFISQSGALLTAILDWSFRESVGFSSFVSVGSMLDVGWGDLIDYLGDDPRTKSIVIYMESIGDARSFLSAAREVALNKPIIVIKAGRTEAASKAAASHTGSLTGSDEVLDAAFRRVGVLRVTSIADLFSMAEILGKQPRPKGPRLTILTNAGGPGVLATDALITSGGQLAPISEEIFTELDGMLPPPWSHANPIDILGDAGPDRYAQSLQVAAKDPKSDGLLVILTPQNMTDPTQTAEQLRHVASDQDKPVLASWMGGPIVEAGQAILNRANIPTFDFPDDAAKAFMYMWRYSYNLRGLYETPHAAAGAADADRRAADRIVDHARKSRRTLLTEAESKQLLAAYGIPTVAAHVAPTVDDAVRIAGDIGYPVVLKLHSETITHKTDVDGVKLKLADADAVKRAFEEIRSAVTERAGAEHFLGVTVQNMISLEGYELIIGSSVDPQFGPVLLFGGGGQLVEVFKDRALALPPLNATLARRMMEQTRIHTALKGVRGRKPVDLAALEQILVRFSQLVVEQPWISEIDVNPLLVNDERVIALDARVVLHDPAERLEHLPRPVIRPYPSQYVTPFTARDGQTLRIRPIRPEDEPLMVRFHQTLSEQSVYSRYFSFLRLDQRITHERLTRVCHNDYDREMALVAEQSDPVSGGSEIVAVGRLSKVRGRRQAEIAFVISDTWQGRGIGTELMRLLLQVAGDEQIQVVSAVILPENTRMVRLCEKFGFQVSRSTEENAIYAELPLV